MIATFLIKELIFAVMFTYCERVSSMAIFELVAARCIMIEIKKVGVLKNFVCFWLLSKAAAQEGVVDGDNVSD